MSSLLAPNDDIEHLACANRNACSLMISCRDARETNAISSSLKTIRCKRLIIRDMPKL